MESVSHIFVTCPFFRRVWYSVFRSLGWKIVLPGELGGVLNLFLGLGRGKSSRCFLLVWHAVVWTILEILE